MSAATPAASTAASTRQAPAPHGLTVWQPRQPMFWFALALIFPSAAITLLPLFLGGISGTGLVAATLVVGVQGLILWLVVRALPRVRRQPASLRIFALVWGMTVAVGSAVFLSALFSNGLAALGLSTFSTVISAPITEDVSRLLGVLAVLTLASRARITVMDGVVYGFFVGMGFELLETLMYTLRSEDLAQTLYVGLLRSIFGFGLHALWTAVAGAALAYCMSRRQRGLGGRWWVLAPALFGPMLMHALWDSPGLFTSEVLQVAIMVASYAGSIALFIAAVRWGRRSDRECCSGTSTL